MPKYLSQGDFKAFQHLELPITCASKCGLRTFPGDPTPELLSCAGGAQQVGMLCSGR